MSKKSRKAKRKNKRQEDVDDGILILTMHVLHTRFGFGKVRLERFFDACAAEQKTLRKPGRLEEISKEIMELTGWTIE